MADDKKTREKQKKIILMAAGEADERIYASMLLERFGYHVNTANTTQEAVEFVSVIVPALIIADETLAPSEGYDLLGTIRENPRTATVPVILVSSSADMGSAQRHRDAGYSYVLQKPLSTGALYQAVQTAIEPTPRKSIRVAVYLMADLGGNTPGFAKYPVILSENGIFVRTTETRPVDTLLPLRLVVKDKTVALEAVVLYSYGFGDYPFKEPGMGMNFVKVSPEDRALIKSFIQEQIEKDLKKRP